MRTQSWSTSLHDEAKTSPMPAARLLVALIVLLIALGSATAFAQSEPAGRAPAASDTEARAAAHFNRGVELFKEGAFHPALIEFQRAYETAPDYRLLYNIGQTQRRVQDYLGAVQSFQRYLTQGGADVPAERAAQVSEVIASLRQRVGRIEIRVSRAGAQVTIDETKVGTSPLLGPIEANVGRHRVSARTADGASDAQVVEVAGGEQTVVALELAAAAPKPVATPLPATAPAAGSASSASAAPEPAAVPSRPLTTSRKAAIAAWSAGGAALIVAGVTGIRTKKRDAELDDLLAIDGVDRQTLAGKRDNVRGLSLATDVLLGVGGAAVVSGTLLWLLAPDERPPARAERVQLDVGLASFGVHGRF